MPILPDPSQRTRPWAQRWRAQVVAQVAALLKQWLRGRRTLTSEAALATARSLMQREPYAFLISHSSTAWLHTRLVQPLCDLATLDVWIGTRADLRKVHEVARNPYVTLAFQNNTQHASLVMYGIAEIKTEVALRERCWLDSWAMFFPDGPAASDYVLVRVIPLRLEVMSFRQKVVGEPFGLAPAVLVRRAGQWCLEGAAR